MVLGKKMAIFDWEWGRNLAPREGQKMPFTVDSYIEPYLSFQSLRRRKKSHIQ